MITYSEITIEIKIDQPINFNMFPPFLFRSIIGNHLKRISCILKHKDCADCSLKHTCPYALLFENPIPKDTTTLKGRNRSSHPFILQTDIGRGDRSASLSLLIRMFGDGVAYMPYLYYAVKRAGEVGLFKARIPYKIQDVRSYDRSILRSDGNIETDIQERRWSLDTDDEPGEKKQRTVRLLTPLRMKKAGNYVSEPGMDDILRASARRVAILEEMYGDGLGEILQDACDGTSFSTIRSNTRWQDLPYYSSRQNRPLMLGGVIGDITVSHPFSAREDSLLQAASVFHIGKNTVFGLGQVEIHEEREENSGEYRQGTTSKHT